MERSWVLTDAAAGLWIETLDLGPEQLGMPGCAVRKRRLRGGLRDGVDLIEVTCGELSFSVVPTRGMGVWRAGYGGHALGWRSPVRGPVHPAFVNPSERGAAILGERVSGLGVRRLTVATRPRWRRAGTLAGRASRQTAGLHDQPLRRAVVGAVARTPDPAGEVRRAVVGRAVAAGGMQATGAGTTETDTGAAAAVASSCVPAPGPRR